MRWPWQQREVRESAPFTDAIVAALAAGVSGDGARSSATAALEAAAGAVARGFAAATVEGAPAAMADALSPATLSLIGRDLIRRGESVFHIEIRRGEIRLAPAGSWDVRGGVREAEWWYRLDLFGPSGNVTRFVPSDAVVHCRYAVDPSRPWLGVSPLGWAALSGELHAGVLGALAADMKALPGTVIPMPPGENAEDEAADPLAPLKTALLSAKGRSTFVETTRSAFGADHRDAPAQDWQQRRLGPAPPDSLASLHDSTGVAVLAAIGVDPLMVGMARGDGTALREAYRRFERLTLQPLARIATRELAEKLDAPDLALGFDSLRASDFAGVARAYKALTEAGLSPDAAAGQLDMDL